MNKSQLEDIIIKEANKTATPQELAMLEEAIKLPENRALFESYIQANHLADAQLNTFDTNAAKAKFFDKIDAADVKLKISWRKRAVTVLKYAAVITLVFLVKNTFMPGTAEEVIDQDAITLELNDGSLKTIHPGNKIVNENGSILLSGDSDQLEYNSKTHKATTLAYNKLHVPYGKQFKVKLSDGTLVYLNSGSTLRYPVTFLNGKSRAVSLDGEAYFVVSKDKDRPFIVTANEVSTQVYGTEFNISSYKNDPKVDIVLVEGSIGVYNNKLDSKKQLLLVPNEKASFTKKDLSFNKETVNAKNFIVWKDGVLLFENATFESITQKLERKYNVSIQNNFTSLKTIEFSGTFDSETIDQVLKSFQGYKSFHYTQTDNQIIINQ